MKVTFIGTSNALPRKGRSQTCIHVEAGGLGHILDCGDGAPTRLLVDPAIDWSALRALLITHFHPDHAAGLFIFLHLLHMRTNAEPAWPLRNGEAFRLCLPASAAAESILACLPAFHLAPEKLCFPLTPECYQTKKSFRAGALTVTPWPTTHCENAHGFTLQSTDDPPKRIVFSGDLGKPEELAEHAAGADLVITECAHFHPRDLVEALEGTGAHHYVVTHLHDRILDQFAEAQQFFAPLAKEGELTFARDGLVVEIT